MKTLCLILCLTLTLFVKAQQLNENAQKAKKILDKAAQKNKEYKTISAQLRFTMHNLQNDSTNISHGYVLIKGEKYKLDLLGTINFFDGQTIWRYIKEANEVNILDPEQQDQEDINPETLFSIYQQGYKYEFIGESFEKAHPLYIIALYPIDIEKKEFSRIEVKIDKLSYHIVSVKYFGKKGINYTIDIIKFKHDIQIDDETFVFDKKNFPDVEIIDLR